MEGRAGMERGGVGWRKARAVEREGDVQLHDLELGFLREDLVDVWR